jgi:thiamine pyrophosphokinase
MKKCIILANGKTPRKRVVHFLQNEGYVTVICADGGANHAYILGLVPDYIIGDLDSVYDSTLVSFKKKTQIIKIKRQNDTDVEKCLKFALKKEYDDIILLGVIGGRLDHTICNLGIVLKFFPKVRLKVIAEDSFLMPYTGDVEINTQKGETISLYAFDTKTKILSNGLKYPLKNVSLPFGEKESTSNVTVSNRVKLKISGGIIFVIRDFRIAKKNDFF